MVAALADSLFSDTTHESVCQELFSALFELFRFGPPPLTSRRTACLLYHTPLSLSTTFFLIFNFFQRFVIPVKIWAYRLCVFHRLYKPSPSMLYYL